MFLHTRRTQQPAISSEPEGMMGRHRWPRGRSSNILSTKLEYWGRTILGGVILKSSLHNGMHSAVSWNGRRQRG